MKTILINNQKWELRLVSRLGRKPETLDGSCDYKNRIIRIRRNKDLRVMRAALIHEVTHATAWYLGEEAVVDLEASLVDGLKKAGL